MCHTKRCKAKISPYPSLFKPAPLLMRQCQARLLARRPEVSKFQPSQWEMTIITRHGSRARAFAAEVKTKVRRLHVITGAPIPAHTLYTKTPQLLSTL